MDGIPLYLGAILAGYLIGSFPTGVVLTKRKYKIDVREIGSGNIGATNVTRVFGWYAGVITLLFDVLKGFFPIYFLRVNYPEHGWLLALSGLALVLGHCFSIFLKFQGGKGVATSLGVVLAVLPVGALIGIVCYAVAFGISRISAVGSLIGLSSVGIYTLLYQPSRHYGFMIAVISLVVLVRHQSNIQRLLEQFRKREEK